MNKTTLKNFAVSARRELIERVELQALKIGISKEKIEAADVESSDAFVIQGNTLTDLERRQRNQLINRIEDKGYDQVIEEVAYTWFNRFVALRYMEVNDYLPTRVRVLSSESGTSTEPDMIKEALTLDLEIDKEKIYNLKIENKTDELFKYLIQLHCNDLNKYMPFMFEPLEDYKMILFPEGLLGTESFVMEMIDTNNIPEVDWQQVEIIGWLYQFYIVEEKDRVFKEKKKYKSSDIPFATQLFTPEWIVKYMVQNSLGKYWVESHPEDEQLIESWDYYLENTDEKYRDMKQELINSDLNVEEIKCFDPAMGSGHILVYMFDLLYEIYSKRGYMSREIPKLIIENNLYGLDIDERAYQLAGFSIIMKALEYNRRFLRTIERDGLTLNLATIEESNILTDKHIEYLNLNDEESAKQYIEQFKHAKSIGSLLKLNNYETLEIETRLEEILKTPSQSIFYEELREQVLYYFPKIIKQTKIMKQKYNIIITNPPYIGRKSINKELTEYLKENYPNSRENLFAPFMELNHLQSEKGFTAQVNQQSWMFLPSFKKLREEIIETKFIDTMLHLGSRAFEEISGEVVQASAFVLRNTKINGDGTYLRLVDFNNAKEKKIKTIKATQDPNVSYYYKFNQSDFTDIPGNPVAYWIKNIKNFTNNLMENIFFSGGRNKTHGDKKYVRYHWEVSNSRNWRLYAKGGEYRKYYGNEYHVVNWTESARENYKFHGGLLNEKYWNKLGITWSLTSSKASFRIKREPLIYSSASPTIYNDLFDINYKALGFLNSCVASYYLDIFNPTLSTTVGDVLNLPYDEKSYPENIDKIVKDNIGIAKTNWNSYEVSYEFKKHPLLYYKSNMIEQDFKDWNAFTKYQFNQFKENEEKLNRIFIEIYELENELTPDVEDRYVTVSKANLERDMKSFISYVIGCVLGRYSLDKEGLIYAGGKFDSSHYQSFPVDENNILPILSGAYFEDDIVSLFIDFIKTVYGTETLEENLTFVAEAIGKRANESSREGIRRYFLNNFYKDHVQTYKKHPIYWQFTSGREKAFNCLIYMHRYDKTTLSRIRTEYLHDVQARYETVKSDLQYVINSDASASEIRNAKKELTSVDKKIIELKEFDEKLHHMADMQIEIDLDDGVKENYEKFKGLVTKI